MSKSIGDKDRNELEFLRFFYEQVDSALGPASDDIYRSIADEWEEEGNTLPKRYKRDDEEDDDE